MKLIESSVEILPQEEGLLGAYKQIEKAAAAGSWDLAADVFYGMVCTF